jgi:hypothetical protein
VVSWTIYRQEINNIIMANYLHKFNTEAAFDAAYNGEDYHEP